MACSVVISSDKIPQAVTMKAGVELEKILFLTSDISGKQPKNLNETVALVKAAFIASRKERVGPAPSKTACSKMEEVIKFYVSKNLPIAVHTVSVHFKLPITHQLDLAEVFFLKSLKGLQDRVQAVYPPGVVVNVRLEDNTIFVLRGDNKDARNISDTEYSKLVLIKEILGYDFVSLIRESDLVPIDKFIADVHNVLDIFRQYINESSGTEEEDMNLESLQKLHKLGFKGYCSIAQRNYMIERLPQCFSELDEKNYKENIARYLSCILVRNRAGATAVNKEWTGGCVMITYTHTNPDAAQVVGGERIQYRYLPSVGQRTIPIWRGTVIADIKMKGQNATSVEFKSRLLSDPQLKETIKVSVILAREEKRIKLGLNVLATRLPQESA